MGRNKLEAAAWGGWVGGGVPNRKKRKKDTLGVELFFFLVNSGKSGRNRPRGAETVFPATKTKAVPTSSFLWVLISPRHTLNDQSDHFKTLRPHPVTSSSSRMDRPGRD